MVTNGGLKFRGGDLCFHRRCSVAGTERSIGFSDQPSTVIAKHLAEEGAVES